MGLNLDKYNPQPVHSHVDMERSDASESVIGCRARPSAQS